MSEVQNDVLTQINATSEKKNDSFVITMTGRRPVRIKKSEWKIMVENRGWEGEYESQANRKWFLKIRKKEGEEKYLVYGGYDTCWKGEKDHRSGHIVENFNHLTNKIYQVCQEIGVGDEFADECIAKLPAEEI